MTDLINHPPHYATIPPGFTAECIEYTRHMAFAQGNAMKYLYRAGSKGDAAEDLAKCAWYLRDALDHGLYAPVHGTPRIDPNITHKSMAGHLILTGRLRDALAGVELIGDRINEYRKLRTDTP